MAAVWRAAWSSGGGAPGRVRVVLGTWTYRGAAYANEMLAFEAAAEAVDALAVTLYWGLAGGQPGSSFASGRGADDVIADLAAAAAAFPGADDGNGGPALAGALAAAAAHGVAVESYEAGPSLVQSGVIGGGSATAAVTDLLVEVARDPRIYDVSKPPLSLLPLLSPPHARPPSTRARVRSAPRSTPAPSAAQSALHERAACAWGGARSPHRFRHTG